MADGGEYRVQVTGLREFQAALKKLDVGLTGELKSKFLGIAQGIATTIAGRVPHGPSGKASASVKAFGTLKGARVQAGGASAPYYPWLDFGGSIGSRNAPGHAPGKGVNKRPFVPEGRYMYPAIHDALAETEAAAKDALRDVARHAGWGWDEL